MWARLKRMEPDALLLMREMVEEDMKNKTGRITPYLYAAVHGDGKPCGCFYGAAAIAEAACEWPWYPPEEIAAIAMINGWRAARKVRRHGLTPVERALFDEKPATLRFMHEEISSVLRHLSHDSEVPAEWKRLLLKEIRAAIKLMTVEQLEEMQELVEQEGREMSDGSFRDRFVLPTRISSPGGTQLRDGALRDLRLRRVAQSA